ncbi:hypothetical protein EHW64_18030 [Erwinia psidii]|uniref:hypothetical protein n=1 Tax=Erwinia psidii TaxID=69224 RepID=UPI00226B0D51|nr:hypothetical protein [Erwinia psidii]MCX8959310.1 hypothetical protein [Erwinia psidii]MCX8962963.1 hypothetical protein [Erwinia psidii]
MKKWLMELMADMTFLWRKSRKSARVVAKSWASGNALTQLNGIASRNGKPANFADPLTAETLINGQPAHFVGQNVAHMNARSEAMDGGQYHRG